MFCPVRCRIVVFSECCLALWSSCWRKGSWLLCFPLVFGLCTVSQFLSGVFALPLSVIIMLWSVIVPFPGISYYSRYINRTYSNFRTNFS